MKELDERRGKQRTSIAVSLLGIIQESGKKRGS
jgi:hypothetical protein